MSWSHSKIETFKMCPYKFKAIYIDKKQYPKKADIADLGKEVHEILCNCFEDDPTSLDEIQRYFTVYYCNHNYCRHLENFLDFSERTMINGQLHCPSFRELKLVDEKNDFVGIIDRVDMVEDNILVLDYKTGKDMGIEKKREQLAVYAYLLKEVKDIEATHWGILYTGSGNYYIEPVDWNLVEKTFNNINKLKEKINNMTDEEFTKTPGYHCSFCELFVNNECEGKKQK